MAMETELLRQTAYFSGMDSPEPESIKSFIQEKRVQKGKHFLLQGESSDFLYLVASGLVKVYKTSGSGREQVLHIAPPGDSLNDVSLFDGGTAAAGMVALNPTFLYIIRKDAVIALLGKKPILMMNILKSLAKRIRRDAKLVEDLSSTQVLERLAKLFIGQQGGEAIAPGLNLSQKEMADLVGSSREMVNRSLKVLEEMGGIGFPHRKVIVLDKGVLYNMAGNSANTPKL